MAYTSPFPDFPFDLAALESAHWYSPSALRQLLDTLTKTLFPIVQQRQAALARLTPDVHFSPFVTDPPTRFAASGVYATTADPYLERILSQLCVALSYKDRLVGLAQPTRGPDDGLITMPPEFFRAQETFASALLALTFYAHDPASYLSRQSFEALYSLTFL